METAFIRAHDRCLAEKCDQAHVPLRKVGSRAKVTAAAYLGTVNGEHEPTQCIVWAHVDTADVWAWVASVGYERMPDEHPAR